MLCMRGECQIDFHTISIKTHIHMYTQGDKENKN